MSRVTEGFYRELLRPFKNRPSPYLEALMANPVSPNPHIPDQGLRRYAVRFGGHCQGVGFRFTSADIANHLHLAGWVKNEDDGSVSMELQGSAENCQRFFAQLQRAYSRLPWSFTVEDIDPIDPIPEDNVFHIRY